MLNDKYGLWVVNDVKFDNKYEALLYATKIKSKVNFWYHDELYNNVDKSLLGKISINQLYKHRAQQLRDKYDYLILYYSGGSDSHNILMTFINNNIKLDEICVRWPKALVDGKFYTPNTDDESSKNLWSEWDFSIKPTLNWVHQNHPNIKIVIKDFTPDESLIDKIFEDQKFLGFRAGTIRENSFSDSELEWLNNGKTVGNIYGVNKPLLGVWNNNLYTYFLDKCLLPGNAGKDNPTGAEFFYWTPDMPILLREQAYQLFLYYNINKDQRKFLFTENESDNGGLPSSVRAFHQAEIAKKVLYSDTWNFRFQAGKKEEMFGKNMYFWMLLPELNRAKEKILDNVIQRTKMIDETLLSYDGKIDEIKLYLPSFIRSTGHYVGSLDQLT